MPKYHLLKILTENGEENIKFFEKVGNWIKANPVLTGTVVVVAALAIGVLSLSRNKQNKRRTKRK